MLDRHLEGVATPEEFRELTVLLRTGEYHDEVNDLFLEVAKARMHVPSKRAAMVDDLFGKIEVALRAVDKPDEAVVVPSQLPFMPRARPAVAAHEAETAVPGILSFTGKKASWLKMAAAITVVIGVSFYYFRNPPGEEPQSAVRLVNSVTSTTIEGENYFRLPDGSTVLLNAGSELSYGESFGKENRDVVLKGEAFFDVKHDPERTFVVHSGSIATSVLGTAFNVKSYPGHHEVVVTVVRGKVRVGDDAQTLATIIPNQQVVVNVATHKARQVIVNAAAELAWKEPYIILDNVNVRSALKIVSEKYNTPIRIEGNGLNGCQVTSVFLHREKLEDVLLVITRSFNATFVRRDGAIVIRGGECM